MAKLHIMNGPFKDHDFALDGDITFIGRSPDNDIQIEDKSISRRHLKVSRKENQYFIKDLKSKNGTFFNGERIDSGVELEVKAGFPIAIGKIFVYLSETYVGDELDKEALDYLDSIDLSEELNESGADLVQDRPLTAKKNMELISKVADVLMESLELEETLNRILNHLLKLLKRTDRGHVILIDWDTGKISKVISAFRQPSVSGDPSYSRSIVDRVRREKKSVYILDTLAEEGVDLSDSMEIMKVRSLVCVPLISNSRLRGVVYVDSVREPYGFRKEDVVLITALSSTAAVAIENAYLTEKLKIGGDTGS